MIVYIEVVIILALVILTMLYWMWFMFTSWRLRRTYSIDKDISRMPEDIKWRRDNDRKNKGEPERDCARDTTITDDVGSAGTEQSIGIPVASSKRPELSEGRESLPTTDVVPTGKDSRRFRGFFKRTRRN